MNRGLFLVLFLLVFLAVIAFSVGGDNWKAEVTFRYQQLRGQTTVVTIGDDTLPVEVALTAAERAKGLSGRKLLRRDTGMLFIFQEQEYWSFWMKDTLVALDMIWIADTKIVDIEHSVPPATSDMPPTYEPAQRADRVLEFSAGTAEALQWRVGDIVEIKNIDKFND